MILQEYREVFAKRLSEMYEPEEVKNLCFLALEHVMKMNRVEVSLSRKLKIPQHQLTSLNKVLDRLEKSEPIQYITGFTEFYGLEFQVNPATLIPRPETEELVEWILNSIANFPTLFKADQQESPLHTVRILDIGTGSGCIAIALKKKFPTANVEGIDISQNALATAYQNTRSNEVDVTFYRQDILETTGFESTYDIIVSNPPYVRQQEKKEMRDNVLSNEPDSALFVSDEDPLIFYKKIGQLAFKSLTESGMLFFEINEYLGNEMVALLKSIGFQNVELRKDIFGKDRMIKAMR